MLRSPLLTISTPTESIFLVTQSTSFFHTRFSFQLIRCVLLSLAFALLSVGCAQKAETAKVAPQAPPKAADTSVKKQSTAAKKATQERKKQQANKAKQVLKTAHTQIGKRYRYGGTSPKTGFDCAGFTQWTYAQHGVKLPRTSREQSTFGMRVPKKQLRPGDLVFYSWRKRSKRVNHVGIYVGDGKYIHSPRTGQSIRVDSAFDKYHAPRFRGARRVIFDADAAPLLAEERDPIVKKALAENSRPKRSATGGTHKIRRGETLGAIAQRYGVSTRELQVANNLKSKHSIRAGQKLIIPGAVTQTAGAPAKKRTPSSSDGFHKVRSGDTIWALSRKYGVSEKEMLAANGLTKRSRLKLGQKLIVPGKGAPAQAAPTTVAQAETPKLAAKKETTKRSAKPAKQQVAQKIPAKPQKPASATSHTIKSGDTIWALSRKYGVSESALLAANNLNKRSKLQLGKKITIPAKGAAASSVAKKTPKVKRYTVKKGDTIWNLARKHGLTEKELLAANNLPKRHTLRQGQKIVIPALH